MLKEYFIDADGDITEDPGFLAWEQWQKNVSREDALATWDHIAHSPNCSIEKAQRLLNYQPRYSSLQAVQESVVWLIENKELQVSSAR